jgi:tetratricopeptide (TPR) repeat protein
MNLDTVRAIRLGTNDERLEQVATLLTRGEYARALEHVRDPGFPTSLPAMELACLVLFANGHLSRARDQAAAFLARAAAESAAQGPARRTLAERLWNIDLRQSYARVRRLLSPADDPDELDGVERFRRRLLMADYAQCRGEYEIAGVCLRESGSLLDAVGDDERAAAEVEYALANCRSLQGRRLFDQALSSVERGLAAADRTGNTAGRIRLLNRRARTQYMMGDRPAGWRTYEEAVRLHERCQRLPVGVVCWEEVRTEVAFTGGELALYDRRPKAAERYLRAGSEAALSIGSHEGYVEAAVMLTASLVMQERAVDAMAQYQATRGLCATEGYADLAGDLDKITQSRRYRALSAIVADEVAAA